MLGQEVTLTEVKSEFSSADIPKLCYAPQKLDQEVFFIPAHPLLFEKEIKAQNIQVNQELEYPSFFSSKTEDADFPFDFLAFCFFLLSRYEEYLPHEADQYGRFKAESSLAYKSGFLDIPLIDLWGLELQKRLQSRYSSLKFKNNRYSHSSKLDLVLKIVLKGSKLSIFL